MSCIPPRRISRRQRRRGTELYNELYSEGECSGSSACRASGWLRRCCRVLWAQQPGEAGMIRTVSQIKDELADREAIKDCLYRYSRGIDRCDMELLRSAYWPGAMDTHTGFKGTIEEFIAGQSRGCRAWSRTCI